MSTKRLDFEYIKHEFSKCGYVITDTEYVNSKTDINFICNKGHIAHIRWNNFLNGSRCSKCRYEMMSEKLSGKVPPFIKNEKKDFSVIKRQFEDENFILLSTESEYKNNQSKLRFICNKGHESCIRYGDFNLKNVRCKFCSAEIKSKKKKLDAEIVYSYIRSQGYIPLSKYKSSQEKMAVACDNGHIYDVKWNNFMMGTRCPTCSNSGHSKAELEIFNLIKSYFPDAVSGDRSILDGSELDIYIPSKKLAIEYCGLFWHSEQSGKSRKYHLQKLEECNKQGIDLITIFEDEYFDRPYVVLSRIKSKLGISDAEHVFARKCSIVEIDSATKNDFLNKFHLQGMDRSTIKLGAFYKGKLMSVMTFSRPSLSKGRKSFSDSEYEMSRFCSDYRYNVIGIASKLFTHFVRNYDVGSVFSFCDLRWSTGAVYKKLGFVKIAQTEPNYWYIIDNSRKHRFNFRKSELERKLDIFDPSLTEVENMSNNGYTRIFDCGNIKWLYTRQL